MKVSELNKQAPGAQAPDSRPPNPQPPDSQPPSSQEPNAPAPSPQIPSPQPPNPDTPSTQTHFTPAQKELLSRAQSRFPIASDPYAKLGDEMGVSGDEAFSLMQDLRERGYVRRLGPIFDSYKLGYVSTLCAVAVPDTGLDEVVAFINGFPQVTHNYLRENVYNIWFTLIAPDDQKLQRIVEAIEEVAASQVLQLPALRLFKIKVDFNIKRERRAAEKGNVTIPREVISAELSADDKALIRVAQTDTFAGRHPYAEIADKVSEHVGKAVSEQHVIDTLSLWKDSGIIRRFGLTLRHRKVGFRCNVMVVWDVPDTCVERAGTLMAAQDEVSHCYERPRVAEWQSNLYTMIHGQSHEECDEAIRSIKAALKAAGIRLSPPQKLFTLRELKKKSMKYFSEEEGS